MARKDGAGEILLAVAALAAIQIAQGRTVDEIELIAALFQVLGDSLSLIAARRSMPDCTEGAEAAHISGKSV